MVNSSIYKKRIGKSLEITPYFMKKRINITKERKICLRNICPIP
jgi:hypothetical protein